MRGDRRAICVVALLLGGCAAMRAPEIRTFQLAYDPPEPVRHAPLPVVVRVVPFGIAAAYDRTAFMYRSGAYDLSIDYYDSWIANPSTMITDLLARDLAASKSVHAVLQAPSALASDYELSGQIETLEERDDAGACSAHLRLRIVLLRVPTQGPRYVVLQDHLSAAITCVRGDPAAYAAAMSRAVQQVSDALRSALVSSIAASLDGAVPSAPLLRGPLEGAAPSAPR